MGSDNRQPAARLGDIDTGHPPYPPTPVITGSTNVFINSRPAARQGDVLAPHHPGVRLITEGSASVLINGRPAARVTDAVNCGGKIVTGSSNVQIGNQPAAIRNPKVRAELSEYVRESLKPENISLTRLERAQLAADIAVKYRGREGAVATWHDYFIGNRPEPGDMGDPLRKAGLERAVSEKAIVTCPSPRDDAESTTADLGDDVNKILAKSPSLQRDLEKLKARGWAITRGTAGEGTYVRETGSLSEIVIDSAENGNEVIQSLAHEVGHAIYSPPVEMSSKEAFVKTYLADEGAATIANIRVQREILAAGGPDIGIAGDPANHKFYNEAYDQYLQHGDEELAYSAIGEVYGHAESTSTTGQSYADYYGDAYDKVASAQK